MNNDFYSLIEEAIDLELNISELYILFHSQYPGDSYFWWELAIDEKNHAALLRTVQQLNVDDVSLPPGLLPDDLRMIAVSNQQIKEAISAFKARPDRSRAFHVALEFEQSAGEIHYDTFMKSGENSELASIFRSLNGNDINHAERIRKYMSEQDIA